MNPLPLPSFPTLPGLLFRPLSGVKDVAGLLAVHLGRAAHDQVDPLSTLEAIPTLEQVTDAVNAAVAAHTADRWVLAQAGDQIVGYNRILTWSEADGTWVYLILGWVLPEWRGRGIGTALLHWAEARSYDLARAEHPGERCELAANASSTEPEATALLQHEGYFIGYTALEMGWDPATPLPAAPLPEGIEVRAIQPDHLLRIAQSVDESYLDEYDEGRFGEDFNPVAYAADLASPHYDPTLWQVAWAIGAGPAHNDEIAGQVMVVIEKGRAEIFEVSVRPAWRRRGLARALLTNALLELRARGVSTIRLHTVAEFRTRASDLYTSAGFRVLKTFPRYRKAFDEK